MFYSHFVPSTELLWMAGYEAIWFRFMFLVEYNYNF